jgi:uncharacterized protein (TIGR02996 family)
MNIEPADSPLFQEILAHPADQELRLVFADWLDEQADPRGELVRLQCQLENMERSDPGYSRLRAKAGKLERQHGAFGSLKAVTVAKTGLRCGFVEWVELTPSRWIKHAAEIVQTTPLRYLRLKGKSARFLKIAEMPELAQLTSLELRQPKIDDAGLEAIVKSPHLAKLETLGIHGTECRSVCRVLAKSPLLSQLTELQISDDTITQSDVQLIGEHSRKLRSLEIAYAENSAFPELAASGLRSLTQLDFNCGWREPPLTRRQLEPFGESEYDQPLSRLVLRPVEPGFAEAFAAPRFLKLAELAIYDHPVKTPDVTAIVHHLTELSDLTLNFCRLRDAAARAIAKSPTLAGLKHLRLTRNQITAKGVEAILTSEFFSPGTELHLAGNPIADREIKRLQKDLGRSFGNFH